jgi:hypothetical protein
MAGQATDQVTTIGIDIGKNTFHLIGFDDRSGSRLCQNDFLEAETKHKIEKLAFAATMIRPRDLPDSIVAQLVSVSTF